MGIVLSLCTGLVVAGAKGKGELDLGGGGPAAGQGGDRRSARTARLRLKSAGLEFGRIAGTGQRLPVSQEVGLAPAP
ncbi:hypothetical protein ACFWZY_22170 [Streptomyces sp. NPDC058992]|uniref:hypothetical protein n=1 Tax=Streptomyces sp. NPDC058992 TaxID=3346688 RepID=UPI0036B597C5